jgi:hypothetical protein
LMEQLEATKVQIDVHHGRNKDNTPHVVRVYYECDACLGSLAQGLGDAYCRYCGAKFTSFRKEVRA